MEDKKAAIQSELLQMLQRGMWRTVKRDVQAMVDNAAYEPAEEVFGHECLWDTDHAANFDSFLEAAGRWVRPLAQLDRPAEIAVLEILELLTLGFEPDPPEEENEDEGRVSTTS